MNQALNPWIPLLSTAIGGMIAFISAYLAVRYQTSSTFIKERLERRLKKAEELFGLILKLEHVTELWRVAAMDRNFKLLKPNFEFPGHEVRK